MKIVIIGGGIAGLAFGIIMKKKGHQIVINERCDQIPLNGNAFMMHKEGRRVLNRILGNDAAIPGSIIDTFCLKRPDETQVKYTQMEPWQCVKRKDLVEALIELIDPKSIKYGRAFSHFQYKNGKAVAAVFANGEIEKGDLFVGADGCNSAVRQAIFGETVFTDVEVQEILGIVDNPVLAKELKGKFTKYQHAGKGISFGCIPFSENEVIWFHQFDVALVKKKPESKKDLYDLAKKNLKDFPPIVHQMLDETDFSGAYLWNTKDFDPLSSFHKKNVVIIGDAAHLALPFTSAGTTNALYDAEQLAAELEKEQDIEMAFTQFYHSRIDAIREHVELGRSLKKSFLHPQDIHENEILIPLINNGVKNRYYGKANSGLEILYITDPICSTCWSIQPQFRKFKMHYEDIPVRYVMGGLLPSWKNFNRGGITQPADLVKHWQEVSAQSGMPMTGSVWLDQPIHSSYPPSIAVKAAQLQSDRKADLFLRRLNELVFMEGQNIARIEVIAAAAKDAALDLAKLLNDLQHDAYDLFMDDIEFVKKMDIQVLPTFIFRLNGMPIECLYGSHPYGTFESIVGRHMPSFDVSERHPDPLEIFKSHETLTLKEFSCLSGTTDIQSYKMIDHLLESGMVQRRLTHTGADLYFYNKKYEALSLAS